MRHNEGGALARRDLELGHGGELAPFERHRRAQHHHVGAGDRADAGARITSFLETRDPRHRGAIVEAQDELHRHLHAPAPPEHHAHEMAVLGAHRHEVDERHRALGSLEVRLEDQAVAAIASAHAAVDADRREAPAAVLALAEQRREARRGIEARPAQPVDRAVGAHERRRMAVADQRIVFNLQTAAPFSHRRRASRKPAASLSAARGA